MENLTVSLSEHQAEAFAQFLKRVGLSDYRALAASEDEAYEMLHGGEQIRKALAEAGYAPR
jgi:ABC-type transport system involved in cytochrome bd biosynthesis fused ATPase/permease subunit